jgi:hypothetical protein
MVRLLSGWPHFPIGGAMRFDPSVSVGRLLILLVAVLAMTLLSIMFHRDVMDLARRIGALENAHGVQKEDVDKMEKDLGGISRSLEKMEKDRK